MRVPGAEKEERKSTRSARARSTKASRKRGRRRRRPPLCIPNSLSFARSLKIPQARPPFPYQHSRPVVADDAQLAQPARLAALLAMRRRRRLAVRLGGNCGHRRRAPGADDGARRGRAHGLRCGRRRRQGALGARERREDAPGEERGGHVCFFCLTLDEEKPGEEKNGQLFELLPLPPHSLKRKRPLSFLSFSRKPSASLSRIASYLLAAGSLSVTPYLSAHEGRQAVVASRGKRVEEFLSFFD